MEEQCVGELVGQIIRLPTGCMHIVMNDEALGIGEDRRGRELAVATPAKIPDRGRNLPREIGQRDDRDCQVLGKNAWIENVDRTEPEFRADIARYIHRFGLEASTQGHDSC